MAITLTGTTGLFTRLGRLAGLLKWMARQQKRLETRQHTTFADPFAGRMDLLNGLPTALEAATATQAAYTDRIVASAQRTLLDMVRADSPERVSSIPIAVAEVIRQMLTAGKFVPRCAVVGSVSSSPVVPNPTQSNVGDGVVVMTIRQPSGLVSENCFGERARLSCVRDRNSGSTSGQEVFRFAGSDPASGRWNHDWPAGSGVTSEITTCDPVTSSVGNSAGQTVVVNGGFDEWNDAGTIPTGWTLYRSTGTAAVTRETPRTRRGTAAVRFSDLSTELRQTTQRVLPSTAYAVSFSVRSPITGHVVVTVDALDERGDRVIGSTGDYLSLSVRGSETSSELEQEQWTTGTAVWFTPRTAVRTIRVRVSGSWDSDQPSGYQPNQPIVDDLLITPIVYPYPGGPGLAIVAGFFDWVAGDGFELALTNSRANADHGFTWQSVFDRFFSTRQSGLLLPSGDPGSGNCIADSLIDTSPTFDDAPSPPPPPATFAPTIVAPPAVQAIGKTDTVQFLVRVDDPDTPIASVTVTATADPSGEVSGSVTVTGTSHVRTVSFSPVELLPTESITITMTATDTNSLTGTAETVVYGPLPTATVPPNSPPTISTIADQSAVAGDTIGPVSFIIGDDQTPVSGLVVFASSSNASVVPNSGLTLAGTGAIRSITVEPLNGTVTGTANITVTVLDGGGLTATDTFAVEFTASPPPPPSPGSITITVQYKLYDYSTNSYVPLTDIAGLVNAWNVTSGGFDYDTLASGVATMTLAQLSGHEILVQPSITLGAEYIFEESALLPSGEIGSDPSQVTWTSDGLNRTIEFRYRTIALLPPPSPPV